MSWLVENTKTGAHKRCETEREAVLYALMNGWTDYTVQKGGRDAQP